MYRIGDSENAERTAHAFDFEWAFGWSDLYKCPPSRSSVVASPKNTDASKRFALSMGNYSDQRTVSSMYQLEAREF